MNRALPMRRRVRHRRPEGEPVAAYLALWRSELALEAFGPPLEGKAQDGRKERELEQTRGE